MKPTDEEIIDAFDELFPYTEFVKDEDILEFFEWAYQEGKKEVIENTRKRPTKMELATT